MTKKGTQKRECPNPLERSTKSGSIVGAESGQQSTLGLRGLTHPHLPLPLYYVRYVRFVAGKA